MIIRVLTLMMLWRVCLAPAHEGHRSHGAELTPFRVVTDNYRDAFLVEWLTAGAIEAVTVSEDGAALEGPAHKPSELDRLRKADRVILTGPSDPVPKGFPLKAPLIQLPIHQSGNGAASPPSKSVRSAPKPQQKADACERNVSWSPPMQTLEVAEDLAHTLSRERPAFALQIERNLLFLRSELGIVDAKLREMLPILRQKKLLAPPCVYRIFANVYHLSILEVDGITLEKVKVDELNAICPRLFSCLVLRPWPPIPVSAQGSGMMKELRVTSLDAGLHYPIRGNYLGNLHQSVRDLESMLDLGERP